MLGAGGHGRGLAAIALAAQVGCGGRAATTLPAAGADADDGAGQLAQASLEVRLGDGMPDLAAEVERARAGAGRRTTRPALSAAWTSTRPDGTDPTLAGSVYGLDSSVGGSMYGFGLGFGRSGFGVAGGDLPSRTDGGDGAVLGTVTWRADGGVAWPAGCAGARVARAGGAVAGAIVYLAGAPLRRDAFDDERWTAARGALTADDCALWPAAQVVAPVPGVVELENGAAGSLAFAVDGRSGPTLEPGARSKLAMTDVGIVRVDGGGRAPAWVLGQTSDYHTVTDALGRFAIDGVPAGSYELVIWYPPLVRAVEDDRPVWTEPTVVRRRIAVGAAATVRASLALTPTP